MACSENLPSARFVHASGVGCARPAGLACRGGGGDHHAQARQEDRLRAQQGEAPPPDPDSLCRSAPGHHVLRRTAWGGIRGGASSSHLSFCGCGIGARQVDLVPKQVVADWLAYLRRFHPTIAFKAATQVRP